MIAALVLLPFEPRPLRFARPVLWAVAFLVWGFVGWIGSQYQHVVWQQLIELAKICAIMLVAVNVLTTGARLRFFMLVFLGCFAFYPVRGALFAYFLYHSTVEGRAAWNNIYSNPNDLAALCLLPLSLSIGMLFAERQHWVRLCAAAGALILPFVILLTQSRGAFIALVVLALVILKGQKRRRARLLLLAAGAGLLIALAAPSSVWTRLATISRVTTAEPTANVGNAQARPGFAEEAAEGSARQRLEIWHVARTIFAEHPIIGVGLGAYQDAHYTYALRPEFDPIAFGHRDAHSTYLRLLAETGLVGFVCFFGMVGAAVYDAERTRRRAKRTHPSRASQLYYMEVGLFGYFVAGIWGSYSSMVLTYVYVAVLYSAARVLQGELLPRRGVAQRRRPAASRPHTENAVAH